RAQRWTLRFRGGRLCLGRGVLSDLSDHGRVQLRSKEPFEKTHCISPIAVSKAENKVELPGDVTSRGVPGHQPREQSTMPVLPYVARERISYSSGMSPGLRSEQRSGETLQ